MSTPIEWTDETWNPTRGCRRISPGCENCYAEDIAYRFSGPGLPYEGLIQLGKSGPRWNGAARFAEDVLLHPLGWRAPKMIFVNSMSDLFYDGFSDAQIDQVWAVMLLTPWHTHQVVTKRPERAARYLNDPTLYSRVLEAATKIRAARRGRKHGPAKASLDQIAISNPATHPPRWIWLLTSVENQETADERIPHLLRCPAAVRGVSYEPALEAVDFRPWLPRWVGTAHGTARRHHDGDPLDGRHVLDWIIAGGESGRGVRPCDVAWLRGAVRQAREAKTPVFVKQLGASVTRWAPDNSADPWERCDGGPRVTVEEVCRQPRTARGQLGERQTVHLIDRKGGNMTEWPADLQVREFPQAVTRG